MSCEAVLEYNLDVPALYLMVTFSAASNSAIQPIKLSDPQNSFFWLCCAHHLCILKILFVWFIKANAKMRRAKNKLCNFGRQFTFITVGVLTLVAEWLSFFDIIVFLTILTKSEPYLGTSEFWMMSGWCLSVLFFFFPSISAISHW